MSFKSINVEMTSELFDRSIKGSPKEAIKELIWNACDADAKNIDIVFNSDGLLEDETISDIFIKDDGHGIPFEYVEEYFGKYGRSQKSCSDKSPGGRVYHGKLGQGRYKSLALGNFVDWKTTYQSLDGNLYEHEIKIASGSRMDIQVSEVSEKSTSGKTGTVVHIHGIPDERRLIVSKIENPVDMVPELLITFAPYLLAYNDISIIYNGVQIDPLKHIKERDEKELIFEQEGKTPVKGKVIVIKWLQSSSGKFYICGNSGVVYNEEEMSLLNKTSTSVYLLSEHFEKMHRENLLDMGLAEPTYSYFYEESKKFVKEFLQRQEGAEAVAEVEQTKIEGIYPFDGEPQDEITRAERKVFDILAVEVNKAVPQLKSSNRQTKKLTYRLLREAINTNPSSIKTILNEVFNLTQQQQDALAELLTHTKLPEIIDIAKTVSDRLSFIHVLEQMVYNDTIGKSIKERSQFHKILLKELWIFGEKYTLGTSDKSLKNVLKEHISKLGRAELIPEITEEMKQDLTRIPDICLFEQICPAYENLENLVIELKRPTFTIGVKEIDQIRDYALTVAKNPLFDKERTKWHFILLGQNFDENVEEMLKNEVVGEGNYYNSRNISISVYRWSQIIQDNKLKYEFLRKKLNHQLSDDPNYTTDYLLTRHAEIFSNEVASNTSAVNK